MENESLVNGTSRSFSRSLLNINLYLEGTYWQNTDGATRIERLPKGNTVPVLGLP